VIGNAFSNENCVYASLWHFQGGKKNLFFCRSTAFSTMFGVPKVAPWFRDCAQKRNRVKISNFVWHSVHCVHSVLATDPEMTGVDLACVPVGIHEIFCKF